MPWGSGGGRERGEKYFLIEGEGNNFNLPLYGYSEGGEGVANGSKPFMT